MGKRSRSFSIDESIDELLRERDDLNPSGAVNTFLQEYVAEGQSTEAALAVRERQLEDDLADAKRRVEQIEDRLERVRADLAEKRDDRRDVFESFQQVESTATRGVEPRELTPTNEAVQHHATKLGMTPEAFLRKYREWSG